MVVRMRGLRFLAFAVVIGCSLAACGPSVSSDDTGGDDTGDGGNGPDAYQGPRGGIAGTVWMPMHSPTQAPKGGAERGRYLVDHVSLCGDCHTPRNRFGVPKQSFYMAGADEKSGPLGEAVPNITPDKETGIGDWKRDDIAELLISGTKPDLDNVQGLMYEVIQGTPHGYKDMRKEDALAIADYLKSIPPIKNKVK